MNKGYDHQDLFAPSEHQLHKIDAKFNLPIGTTYKTVELHGDPVLLNAVLQSLDISFDDWGMLPKCMRDKWRKLLQQLDISDEYWKDLSLLQPPSTIMDLHGD